jgi:hypothetical protein
MLADGLVLEPGAVAAHGQALVVKDHAHDLEGDVVVDQPGPQGVAELVGGHMHRPAFGVVDVAGDQPLVELPAIGGVRQRRAAVRVSLGSRQQYGRLWEAFPDLLLLAADRLQQLVVDGD